MSKHVVCIGAALIDELYYATDNILLATTNTALLEQNAGGVGRNIAHQLALLGVPVKLITVLGNDAAGISLKEICESAGVDVSLAVYVPATDRYTGIINKDGSLFTAFITNSSMHLITPEYLQAQAPVLREAAYLLADTNLSIAALQWLAAFSNENKVPLIIEPVSVPPARKLQEVDLCGVYLITPNEDELAAICTKGLPGIAACIDELLAKGVQHIWLHEGASGSVLYHKNGAVSLPAIPVEITDCTGAGDASLTGFILGKWLGKNDKESLQMAHSLASQILQVKGAIHTTMNKEYLLATTSKYYPPA